MAQHNMAPRRTAWQGTAGAQAQPLALQLSRQPGHLGADSQCMGHGAALLTGLPWVRKQREAAAQLDCLLAPARQRRRAGFRGVRNLKLQALLPALGWRFVPTPCVLQAGPGSTSVDRHPPTALLTKG